MCAEHKYALIFLTLGLCALGVSAFLTRSSIWEPLSFRVNLEQGVAQSRSFSVGMDAEYLVELEVDRALPFEQLNCLLGINPGVPVPCEGDFPVEFTWQVVSVNPEAIVAAGSSREPASGAWGHTVSRSMGSFSAKKGHEYVLDVSPMRIDSELKPAHPRIVVRQHPLQSKGNALAAQLVFWFGMAVTAIALVWLAFRRFRLRSP